MNEDLVISLRPLSALCASAVNSDHNAKLWILSDFKFARASFYLRKYVENKK